MQEYPKIYYKNLRYKIRDWESKNYHWWGNYHPDFKLFWLFFSKFLGILSDKAREKEKFPTLESLAKYWENKELWIKNHDKSMVKYVEQFFKKKNKLFTTNSVISSASKCKFCK